MRIAFIGGSLSWRAFGVKVVLERLSAALAERGEDIKVFGMEDEAWSQVDVSNWTGAAARTFATIGPQKFGFAPGLQAAVEAFRPDIIHSHGLWMYNSVVSSGLRQHGIPNVISPHGMLDHWALQQSRKKKLVAGKLFENRHLSNAACLHALNAEEAASLRSYGLTTPVAVLPNGVDLPKPEKVPLAPAWRARLPNDARVLLYLGRLHRKKNLRALVQAFAAAHRDPWNLVIAGPDQDNEVATLQRCAAERGIAERVHFVGAQFDADKSASFAAADGFVLPSLSEGLPMAVLEAWAARVPVLMSEECNLPNGFLQGAAFPTGVTAETIAQVLREFFDLSHERRAEIGGRGLELVRRDYSWAGVASHFVTLYEWCQSLPRSEAPDFLNLGQSEIGT